MCIMCSEDQLLQSELKVVFVRESAGVDLRLDLVKRAKKVKRWLLVV